MELHNEITTPEERKTQIWVRPWRYTESFIIAVNISVLGVAIEAMTGGNGIHLPAFPLNLYAALAFIACLVFIYFRFRERPFMIWLSGVPAAISAIAVYSFLVLLLGFIPQDYAQPPAFLKLSGLSHVKSSWPFFLIQLYFLAVLAMVTLRRAIPFKTKNIGFILNHFGLWVTIFAAGLSASDLNRFSVNLLENEREKNEAIDEKGATFQLPFSLKLLDFNIIEYHPKIGVFDLATGKFMMGKSQSLPFAEQGLQTELGGWHIKVLKYLPFAMYKGDAAYPADTVTGYPAAYVFAKNTNTSDTVTGWISTGSVMMHPDYLALKDNKYLMLNAPEPKKFYSKLVVFKGAKPTDTIQVEVNKPYSVGGWTIYQSGYNAQMRRWSPLSVIEAVRDTWLPLVYIGIAFLLAGAAYMFWIGKDKKD